MKAAEKYGRAYFMPPEVTYPVGRHLPPGRFRGHPHRRHGPRWSGDVTAGCDGLRLHFLWDGDLPEVYRVRGFAPDGACCFFGYADQQKLTVTPGQRRGFVYARSSACLLLDNEALPISLNAPNVDQMVHHYAAPFGFTAALPAGTAPGQYTVEKGTSCFGALQGFMQVLGAKGVFVDPENRLCVYGSEAPVTLPGDQITSITAVIERGEASGNYCQMTANRKSNPTREFFFFSLNCCAGSRRSAPLPGCCWKRSTLPVRRD